MEGETQVNVGSQSWRAARAQCFAKSLYCWNHNGVLINDNKKSDFSRSWQLRFVCEVLINYLTWKHRWCALDYLCTTTLLTCSDTYNLQSSFLLQLHLIIPKWRQRSLSVPARPQPRAGALRPAPSAAPLPPIDRSRRRPLELLRRGPLLGGPVPLRPRSRRSRRGLPVPPGAAAAARRRPRGRRAVPPALWSSSGERMEADRRERRREARARRLPLSRSQAARPGGASARRRVWGGRLGLPSGTARETPPWGWGRSRIEAPSRGAEF